jgi:branched-chain amino acid transport system substrate-binding protein
MKLPSGMIVRISSTVLFTVFLAVVSTTAARAEEPEWVIEPVPVEAMPPIGSFVSAPVPTQVTAPAELSVTAPASSTVTAPAPARTTGVTETEVVIGTSAPFTGPASDWGLAASAASAYIQIINENGGINGRKIRFIAKDDGFMQAKARINVVTMMTDGIFAFFGIAGGPCVMAARDVIAPEGIPWISPEAESGEWRAYKHRMGNIFTAYPDYRAEGAILGSYAVKSLGAKKIAVFHQNDAQGLKGLEGATSGAKEGKAKVVVMDLPYEPGATEAAPFVEQVRKAKVDAVILYSSKKHAAMLAKGLTAAGLKPKLLGSFTLGEVGMAESAGEAWNGAIVSSFLPMPDEDEKAKFVLELISGKNPEFTKRPMAALAGIALVETMKDWDGEIVRKVTFGPSRRQGVNSIYLVKMENGKRVKLTDWMEYGVEY